MLRSGLYEQVISQALHRELAELPKERKHIEPLDAAEAPQVLSEYVAGAVRAALEAIPEGTHEAESQEARRLELVNAVLDVLAGAREDLGDRAVEGKAERLLQVLSEKDPRLLGGKEARDVPRPETPMASSSLFTGAAREPKLFTEFQREIQSADRIDMLVSFVKWSGLRLIYEDLERFTKRGGQLRVITTSYLGVTEMRAVEALATLPNTHIRISYDTKRTRLHAKTYVFFRETGFTTAYVGSSNLSDAAMSDGLEWNLKLTAMDQGDMLRKIGATFDGYWCSDEFEDYIPEDRGRLAKALRGERMKGVRPDFVFEIRPYPYQQAILEQLRAEREVQGSYRNLVVAATGTGKTVIAAFDYLSFRRSHPGDTCRLLFFAHREEILRQSMLTFQGVLRDVNFGELWVGNHRPERAEHIFASVQTLNVQAIWNRLSADYFDYIVVDEGHHAAADSYGEILRYFAPKVLLGLTATPERMDGRSILPFFNHRIAAQIRLPEAIDRKLLCPFQYFGVSDTVDLDELKWTRGGYDRQELSQIYTLSGAVARNRADHVLMNLEKYASDMDDVKALGFCVSVEHAHFMAEHFCRAGVPSIALDGRSGDEARRSARERLINGDVKVIFTVDLYNEGVDIPELTLPASK